MQLYLVQHGEVKPKEADPDRPLTECRRARNTPRAPLGRACR